MNKYLSFLDLHAGEEVKERVLDTVKANTSFRGANLWILACAIVIASVGLNVNSTAVIIGAMLISPLMGPIVGAGFSLAVFDFELLRKSLKNLLIATLVSLCVATLYFTLSPFKETQSELLARTSPNIYDVLIAFFGGLVGVIAITRVEKGNPIPGVAIATALMPPLCTAGYGLSIGNLMFFLGAIYLYTINCVFICISTFLIVKYLKYPAVEKGMDARHHKRLRYGITFLILVLILPSIYLAYNLLEQKKYAQKVDEFIAREFTESGQTIIYKQLRFNSSPKSIDLAFLTKRFSSEEINMLNDRLKSYGIHNTRLTIKQDTTDIRDIIKKELVTNKSYIDQKDIKIAELEKRIKEHEFDNNNIRSEARILFPEIQNLSIADHTFNEQTDSVFTVALVMYGSKTPLPKASENKLALWLRQKLHRDRLEMYRIESRSLKKR